MDKTIMTDEEFMKDFFFNSQKKTGQALSFLLTLETKVKLKERRTDVLVKLEWVCQMCLSNWSE